MLPEIEHLTFRFNGGTRPSNTATASSLPASAAQCKTVLPVVGSVARKSDAALLPSPAASPLKAISKAVPGGGSGFAFGGMVSNVRLCRTDFTNIQFSIVAIGHFHRVDDGYNQSCVMSGGRARQWRDFSPDAAARHPNSRNWVRDLVRGWGFPALRNTLASVCWTRFSRRTKFWLYAV